MLRRSPATVDTPLKDLPRPRALRPVTSAAGVIEGPVGRRVTGQRRPIPASWAVGGWLLLMTSSALAEAAGGVARTEPHPGTWQTWVLSSGSQLRVPPPPDTAATRAEIAELRALEAARTPEARIRIAWWDAVAPSYRWNQIAVEEALGAGLNANVASRRLAVLHTALADAMVATWDSKYAHNRPRPSAVDGTLRTVTTPPPTPSYPDEHAAAGAVAATILAELFPQRASEFARLAEEEGRTRLLAGVAFPTDVAAGTELGRRVAALALERARRDGSDRPWTGSVPTGPDRWNGTNPVMPQAATWMPWLLSWPSEFRPPAPPLHDQRAAEMNQLRSFERTPRTNAQALFWEVAVGGLRNFEYWNNHAARLTLEYGQGADAPRTARAFALLNVAFYDAGVACWDAKYAYWTIRPFQLDPQFRTVVPTPNHPSYPAAHACYSMASALVLAHLFPRDAEALRSLGKVAGASRIWAGIHYPSDVAAGEQIAERVAARAIERARRDGAEREAQ